MVAAKKHVTIVKKRMFISPIQRPLDLSLPTGLFHPQIEN
jgi:hypothetical protein